MKKKLLIITAVMALVVTQDGFGMGQDQKRRNSIGPFKKVVANFALKKAATDPKMVVDSVKTALRRNSVDLLKPILNTAQDTLKNATSQFTSVVSKQFKSVKNESKNWFYGLISSAKDSATNLVIEKFWKGVVVAFFKAIANAFTDTCSYFQSKLSSNLKSVRMSSPDDQVNASEMLDDTPVAVEKKSWFSGLWSNKNPVEPLRRPSVSSIKKQPELG